MLVEFSVANYRSIRDTLVLSMETAAIKAKDPAVDAKNLILLPGTKTKQLLKLKALFGGNASGKSNVFMAMIAMFQIVKHSFKNEEILQGMVEPFLLDKEHPELPTFFEILLLIDGKQYRYGFEATHETIVSEWLFGPAKERETYYFTREGTNIQVNRERFPEGAALVEGNTSHLLRQNALLLSLAQGLNGGISTTIIKELGRFDIIEYENTKYFFNYEKYYHPTSPMRKKLILMLQKADISINDMELISGKNQELVIVKKMGKTGDVARFLLRSDSQGTQKMALILTRIMETIDRGGLIFIDELDAKLHPSLTEAIIDLFQDKATNPHNAQLIFIAHDANLMSLSLFRRDQIELVNRSWDGATTMTPLVNYKLRNDKEIRQDYLQGSYKGVPHLNLFHEAAKLAVSDEQ